jgi:hypothetical protein
MSWEDVLHFIAQGSVNIAEGHTTIEAGSPVHKAMEAFCEYVMKGCVAFNPQSGFLDRCGKLVEGIFVCNRDRDHRGKCKFSMENMTTGRSG